MVAEAAVLDTRNFCFNKNEFIKEGFDVGEFVCRERRRCALETLRDDLGLYLKRLRSDMIELINSDYADFVNLSSNLVGLDTNIGRLQEPLELLRKEVKSLADTLDVVSDGTSSALTRLHQVRAEKETLRLLSAIPRHLQRLETLTANETLYQDEELMDRVCTEYNQLIHSVESCSGFKLVDQLSCRVQALSAAVSKQLQLLLLATLAGSCTAALEKALRLFIALDKIGEARSVFVQHVVTPYMTSILHQSQLRAGQSLSQVYDQVVSFVPNRCSMIVPSIKSKMCVDPAVLSQFDLLITCVWPVIASCINSQMSSIFAPGNPDTFYMRYTDSMKFVEAFEAAVCTSASDLKRLRQLPSMCDFVQSWNLPVYYQIRFQEIAGQFEYVLSLTDADSSSKTTTDAAQKTTTTTTISASKTTTAISASKSTTTTTSVTCKPVSMTTSALSKTQPVSASATESSTPSTVEVRNYTELDVCTAAWYALGTCWTDGVFVTKLAHRFFGLSLQILSRIHQWARARFVNDKQISLEQCIRLEYGLHWLRAQCPFLLHGIVLKRLPNVSTLIVSRMEHDIYSSSRQLLDLCFELRDSSCQKLLQLANVHVRCAGDIPRLYRRTNRDMPSVASGYVGQLVDLLAGVRRQLVQAIVVTMTTTANVSCTSFCDEFMKDIAGQLCDVYAVHVDGVLTSVLRMESSLRRLKKSRQNPTSQSAAPPTVSGSSDDDKIRRQLLIDVEEFGSQLVGMLKLARSRDLAEYAKLLDMVHRSSDRDPST